MSTTTSSADLPRELERSGALCLAFANGAALRPDGRRRSSPRQPWVELGSYDDLLAWCRRMGALSETDRERLASQAAGRPGDARAALARASALRDALTALFAAEVSGEKPPAEALGTLNEHLGDSMAARRLKRTGRKYAWDRTAGESLEMPLWPIASSAAELLTSDKLARVRQCAAEGCTRFFVARSPRRRWCDMNVCGNRGKGRRFQKSLRRDREYFRRHPPWKTGPGFPA